MKQVRETTAAKAISAYVILDKKGNDIATIHAHTSAGGTCTVDVWEHSKGLVHQGRASGYGYDKFTSAIAGAVIAGIKIVDHCGEKLPLPKGCNVFPQDFVAPAGFMLANWDRDLGGYRDCYRRSGLDGLKHKFRVIQVI